MSTLDLWLPILLAGVATHILSTLFWTAFPHHKPEWNKIPVEDEFIDWLNAKQVPANQYMFPYADSGAEANNPEFKAKQAKCRGMLVLWPEPIAMGPAILKTLLFFLFAAFSVGYVGSLALKPGASFSEVFRVVTTVGLLTHIYAKFPAVFWFKEQIAMSVLDGLAYAVATGLIFAAMWPAA
jgi:hypothetical protein